MARSTGSNRDGGRARDASRRAFLVVVASAALGGCGAAAAPAVAGGETGLPPDIGQPLAPDSPARAFIGTYRFVGSDAEREAVVRAIDESVAQLGSFVRGFAKSRLLAANRIPAELVMMGGGNSFVVLVDKRPYAGLLDGTPVKVKVSTGDEMDMSFKFGAEMVQTFSDPKKGRVNRFELRGDRLVMHVRVYATQLPEQVTYDLTFARHEGPGP
ncbi:MAG TPA: hypothetical protein VHB21_00230 [Minicystis sp.]|nr:hypothetical protein [Minicystis sp.]